MNRRSFLKWFGFGAAAVAVPAIAAPEKSGMALLHATGPSIEEAAKVYSEHLHSAAFHTKTVSLEEARAMFPAPSEDGDFVLHVHPNSWLGLQWTKEQQDAMRKQERRPLVINRI